MSKTKSIKPNILETNGIPFNLIRFWNSFQRNYSAEGITVIEYAPTVEEGNYWRCFIGEGKHGNKGINIFRKNKENNHEQLNDNLKKCFIDPDFRANRSFWNDFDRSLEWKGCFMPVNELLTLSKSQIVCNITFLKFKQDYFPFTSFLSKIRGASFSKEEYDIPLPVLAIWYHFIHYVDFLKEISIKNERDFSLVKDLFKEHIPIAGFDQKMPSEQLADLLYLSIEQFYLSDKNETTFEKLLDRALLPVQEFFKKHEKVLTVLFEDGSGVSDGREPLQSEHDMRKAFFEICTNEIEIFKIQEILDDKYGHNFIESSEILDAKYGKSRKKSLTDRLKTVVGNTSILDRIQAVSDKVQSIKKPLFAPRLITLIEKKEQKWFDLSVEETNEILDFINNELDDKSWATLTKSAEIRWRQSFQNILNEITGPFMLWERKDEKLIPQINCLNPKKAKELKAFFWAKREEEEREMEELQKQILELYKLNHHEALENYLKGFSGFSYRIAQEKWEQAINKHRININTRQNYRMRRMQEFGILGKNERINTRKEQFLDEMLKIEEEVKPYVLFVKKAFQSALPIRKTTEFHPYRHSHDGVEFDPETLQDQDKWLRGNVMKSLQTKIDKGEVTQVNAFCLDSSGSMDHERMRNLFKVLYLLIMGLEDRKSFDAIHFFNTYFQETVNFSDNYTNRTLLFQVMKRITTLSKEGVEYYGSGGTNISDGVENCHTRIKDFVKDIKEKRPDANVVSSIFVITDGEPSMGVINIEELNEFIETKRQDGDVAIKGIYIKPEDDNSDFMGGIFGEDHFVENTDFHEAVNDFVSIMTATYKAQRLAFKWKKRRKKVR